MWEVYRGGLGAYALASRRVLGGGGARYPCTAKRNVYQGPGTPVLQKKCVQGGVQVKFQGYSFRFLGADLGLKDRSTSSIASVRKSASINECSTESSHVQKPLFSLSRAAASAFRSRSSPSSLQPSFILSCPSPPLSPRAPVGFNRRPMPTG